MASLNAHSPSSPGLWLTHLLEQCVDPVPCSPHTAQLPGLTHLLVVHTIIVVVIITGIAHSILVKVLLPRVGQVWAIILRDKMEVTMTAGGALRAPSPREAGSIMPVQG